jgi:cell division protein FtsW (lipid II flippase)
LPIVIIAWWTTAAAGFRIFRTVAAVIRRAGSGASWQPRLSPRYRAGSRPLMIVAGVTLTTGLALAPEISLLAGSGDAGIDVYMTLTILNWCIASAAVIRWGGGHLLAWFWITTVVLAAISSLFLTALGMDGDSSHWAAFMLRDKLMFLDLVPPWVFAIALIDPRVMRPWLQRLIGAGQPGILMQTIRWAPVLLLFAAMMLWLAIGGQAGVEGFNPIEFGKFAIGVILAGLLVGLDPSELRRMNEVQRPPVGLPGVLELIRSGGLQATFAKRWRVWLRWSGGLLAAAVLFFATGSLVVVPIAQSDYSPLLIILAEGAVIFAAWFLLSVFDWVPGAWSYALRRRTVPARFLPVATLYGAEVTAAVAAGILAVILHFWPGLPPLALLIIFMVVQWATLRACRQAFGQYSVTNGIAVILPFAFVLVLLAAGTAISLKVLFTAAAVATAVACLVVRMEGWRVRRTRWNRLVAIWPVAGVVLLLLAGTAGVDYALAWIGIPKWVSTSRETAIDELRKDYSKSDRPALIGRFISWFDLDTAKDTGRDTAKPAQDVRHDVRYRDFGLQVIRSRAVIAAAPCGIDAALAPEEPLFRGVLSVAAAWGLTAAARLSVVEHGVMDSIATMSAIETRLCAPAARAAPDGHEKALSRQLYDGGNPMRVPVVQFDFPATFLIGRFGLSFAAVLLFVQASAVLIGAGGFLWLARGTADGEIDTRVRRFLSIVLLGCTTLLALQWAISWCNILGLLPVMGQPMLWLSAGVSHQILLVFPCIIAAIVALRYGGFTALNFPFRKPPS